MRGADAVAAQMSVRRAAAARARGAAMKQALEPTRLEPAAAAGRVTASMAAVEAPIELTIIVPMFNEAAVLDRLFERLGKVMERLGLSYEIVVVNDGSTDETLAGLLEHRARNPAIQGAESFAHLRQGYRA